jgi:hypothetical protein
MSYMHLPRPNPEEFGPNFGKYMRLVPDGDLGDILYKQLGEMAELLNDLSEADSLVHHPPYTWSIREVVGHMTDVERVFAYRAMRIARGDQTPLPSFDENAYMLTAKFNRHTVYDLMDIFMILRISNIKMFKQFDAEAWQRKGTASNIAMTPLALAYAIAGHCKHHLDIVKKRLGV